MINEGFFITETLQTVHTEMLSFFAFCLVVHKLIEVFDEYTVFFFFPFVINSRFNILNFSFDM